MPPYLDDKVVAAMTALGGVTAIAPSHPHHLGVQTAWSRAFGDTPILVNARDREWVQRTDAPFTFWDHLT